MTSVPAALPIVGPSPSFGEVPPVEVHRMLGAGDALLIDVREPDEFSRQRIEGARLIPLSRFDPALALAMARPGQRIIFQCQSGKRSAGALRLTRSTADGQSLASMTGGIAGWKTAGLPVVNSGRRPGLSVMRQVQLVIGVMVLTGAALAYFVHPAFAGVPAFFGAGLVFAGASGTCGLAALLARMPWNRTPTHAARADAGTSCCGGSTGCCRH